MKRRRIDPGRSHFYLDELYSKVLVGLALTLHVIWENGLNYLTQHLDFS